MFLMKFKTNLVFIIFLVVVYGFMDSHKDMNVNKFRIPTNKHFFKKGKCGTCKGVNFVVYSYSSPKLKIIPCDSAYAWHTSSILCFDSI